METEQRKTMQEELNDKLRDTLIKTLDEIAQQFGDRYNVGFFHYEGDWQTNYLSTDVFYFQKDRPMFRNFAQNFIEMLIFVRPLQRGYRESTVQIFTDFCTDKVPVLVKIIDNRYEQTVRKHLAKFALQNNRAVEYI